MCVATLADCEPLGDVHIHFVAGSSVVVNLHRTGVGHVVAEIQPRHQVLLGLRHKRYKKAQGQLTSTGYDTMQWEEADLPGSRLNVQFQR